MLKEEELLAKRLLELSRQSFHRGMVLYTDFLNLNEQNILHSLPKNSLYTKYVTFGGYDSAERRMAAFLPDDTLSLRGASRIFSEEYTDNALKKREIFMREISVLCISPLHRKYAEELTHRDYLGAVMNLGIERGKTGDILVDGQNAVIFVASRLKEFLKEQLTQIRHTSVLVSEKEWEAFQYTPEFEEIRGTVPSIRLDALLSLAFTSSRSRLTGLIGAGKVFVNGKLVLSNGYQLKEKDLISVRGMGKFQYIEQLSVTKKNRIYVLLHKYI